MATEIEPMATPEAEQPVRAGGVKLALRVAGAVLLLVAAVALFTPLTLVEAGPPLDLVEQDTRMSVVELLQAGEPGEASGVIASVVVLGLLGFVALMIARLPLEYSYGPHGRRGVRVGGFLLTLRTLVWLGVVLAIGVILWNYGGGSATFEVRVGKDPTKDFDWAFVWAYVPDFLRALWILVQATVGGFAVAVVLGLFLAIGRRSRLKVVSWPVALFIEFVRSTPLLVQLFFLFFALPRLQFLPDLLRVWSPLTTLVIGLGIHYATYCSEAYRAGINSVPKGQWEAATAMNLGTADTWTQVILPQAIPNVLPALGNFLIAAFKDAPLGYSIQVTEVLFFARTTTSRTFAPVELYTLIGIGFLAVSIPAAYLIRRLERRIAYERID
jgi:polar amino acid transport system permease protein